MIQRLLVIALAVIAVAAAVPAWRHLREPPPVPPATVRGVLDAPPGGEFGAGDDVFDAAVSSDGSAVAFVATRSGDATLWTRTLTDGATAALEGTAGASMPTWHPDGASIAFVAERKLKVLTLPDRTVREVANAPAPAGVAWLPDGALLFSSGGKGPLTRVENGATSPATVMRPGDVAHVFPSAAGPAGDFVYIASTEGGRRMIRLVRGGEEVDLGRTSGHAEIAGGVLVHVVDGTLSAQRLDAENGRPRGRATPLAFGVGVSPSGRGYFSASARLIVWAAAAAPRAHALTWFGLDGERQGTVGEPADYWQVRLSPDDTRAAVTMLDPLLRTLDVFVRPLDRPAIPRRVSLQISPDTDPVWAPDGTRVLFRSLRAGRPDLVTRPAEFSEAEAVAVVASELDETGSDWRGTRVLFQAPGAGTGSDLWVADTITQTMNPVTKDAFNDTDGRWSPDGRWIAYVSDEGGQPDVFVRADGTGERVRVTLAGGTRPRWSRDARTLYFLRNGNLLRVRLDATQKPVVVSDAAHVASLAGARDYDVGHRTDRLLAVMPVERPEAAPPGLIVDWQSLMPAADQ